MTVATSTRYANDYMNSPVNQHEAAESMPWATPADSDDDAVAACSTLVLTEAT